MFSKGADVDALRESAGRMAAFGTEVDVVRARSQQAVSTMQRVWQGPDLQHLVERWRRVEHDLARIGADFDRLSRRLHDNADLQHRASGRPTHPPGHSPGAGAGGGGGGAGAGGGVGGGGQRPAAWAAPVGASFVAAGGTPQAHTAMGWAQSIGLGEAFELQHGGPSGSFQPVRSPVAGAAAAHRLGLPIR